MATDSRNLPDLENKPGKTNWVEKAGGLPKLIERIAKHLVSEQQYTESRAIATAVNTVRKVCATGRAFGGKTQVNASYRAECCNAAREWESKKGKGKLREAIALIRDDAELPLDDLAALGAAAAERLAMLDRVGLPATGPGAEFDGFLVEATAGQRAGTLPPRRAPGQRPSNMPPAGSGKFDESKHPRGGKDSAAGGKFVSKGGSGTEVRAVQRRVGARVDGQFGDRTKAAVERFQRQHGLKVDGIVGRQTVAALRGRRDAKRVKTGALTDADRQFLSGHVRGRGRQRQTQKQTTDATGKQTTVTRTTTPGGRTKTVTTLVEAVAAPQFLERVKGLQLGELARLPDGGAVKHHASEDGRALWTPGRPSSYMTDGMDWGTSHRTVEEAVAAALTKSAGSTDPESLGGSTRWSTYSPVTVSGRPARFSGVHEAGHPLVTYDGANEPEAASWPALTPAARLLD